MKKTVLIFMLVSLLFICGCSNGKKETTERSTQVNESVSINFLTGKKKEGEFSPRPVAVTVNNLEASLPQYGISEADVLMEFPVEGGITRLMAVYSDYRDVPEVCSVRSCRYYFPVFAKGFDAVYFCFGSNELLANPILEKLEIDYIDGNAVSDERVFGRDKDREEIYASEHTVYLEGDNMEEIFETYGFRKELSGVYGKTAFNFADEKQKFLFECDGITGSFSSSYASGFFYDAESETYLKTHNGKKHIDAKSLDRLSFTNVFLLECNREIYEDTNLVTLDWKGGKGYYATMGTVEEIYWQKKSEDTQLIFFDSSKKPLKINKGKSYIGVGIGDVIMSKNQE